MLPRMTVSAKMSHTTQTTAEKLDDLRARRAEALAPMGEQAHAKVRDAGRLTARERLDYILDE